MNVGYFTCELIPRAELYPGLYEGLPSAAMATASRARGGVKFDVPLHGRTGTERCLVVSGSVSAGIWERLCSLGRFVALSLLFCGRKV